MVHHIRQLLQHVSLPSWRRARGPTPSEHAQEHPDFPPTTLLPHIPQDAAAFALRWIGIPHPDVGTFALAARVLHVATVIPHATVRDLQAYVLARSSRPVRREVARSPNPAARQVLSLLCAFAWRAWTDVRDRHGHYGPALQQTIDTAGVKRPPMPVRSPHRSCPTDREARGECV
jgi:hypothetical protein